MKHEAERKAFVNNPGNWQFIDQIGNVLRLVRLQYKDAEWFKVETNEQVTLFNYETDKQYQTVEWVQLYMFKYSKDKECFIDRVSTTQIVNEIKALDHA